LHGKVSAKAGQLKVFPLFLRGLSRKTVKRHAHRNKWWRGGVVRVSSRPLVSAFVGMEDEKISPAGGRGA